MSEELGDAIAMGLLFIAIAMILVGWWITAESARWRGAMYPELEDTDEEEESAP